MTSLRWTAALLLLGGCAAGSCGSPARSTVLYARGDQTDSLDPQGTAWGGSAKILVNLYETLVTFSDDGVDLVPGLAERWERSEDGLAWTFHLRGNVRFHDGTAFDAGAVAFTFERLLGRGRHVPRNVPYGPEYEEIEKVEARDPRTVVFTLRSPSVVFLPKLAMFCAGIVSPETVRRHGADFARNPCGTGPLKFESWEQDVKIVLTRNPDYWGGRKAKMDRLIVLEVKDVQTAIEKLRRGEVHVVDHVTPADAAALAKDQAVRMEFETPINVCYLGFNVRKHPYRHPDFRRAVAHALDRRKIIDIAYHGQADPARAVVPPSLLPNPDGPSELPHDEARARELLSKVGLPEDFEAVLWHMTYPRPYVPEPDKLVQVIKESLARIGLKVRLEGFHQNIYTSKLRDPEHPMFILGWNADFADPDNFLYALLHRDAIGPDPERPTGNNHTFFDHPRFNEVVKRAQSESAGRSALYLEALGILADELPLIPLAHVRQVAAVAKGVKYNLHPIEYRLWTIERGQ